MYLTAEITAENAYLTAENAQQKTAEITAGNDSRKCS